MNKGLIMTDAKRLSTTPKEYVEKNAFQYQLCIDTWIGLARKFDNRLADIYRDFLETHSLVDAITIAQVAADKVIKLVNGESRSFTPEEEALILGLRAKDALQLLRYPKRFSPLCADKLREESLRGFLSINNRCKQIGLRARTDTYTANGQDELFTAEPFNGYITKMIHDVACSIDYKPLVRDPEEYTLLKSNKKTSLTCTDTKFAGYRYVTNGASADAGKLLAAKISALRVDLTTPTGSRVSGYTGPAVYYTGSSECTNVEDTCIYTEHGNCTCCPMHEKTPLYEYSEEIQYRKPHRNGQNGHSYKCGYTGLECNHRYGMWEESPHHPGAWYIFEQPVCLNGGQCPVERMMSTIRTRKKVGFSLNDWWVDGTPCANVLAVPKSYKAARIVAEEPSYRQYMMTDVRARVLQAMRPWLRHYDPERQEPNQVAAFLGSMDHGYATIDLTSASDTISVATAHALLPDRVVRDASQYRSRFLLVKGRIVPNYIWMTSGCVLTFPLMVWILVSICEFAASYTSLFTGEEYLECKVYGDDLCIDSRLVPLVLELLEHYGFIVNEAKSYWGEQNFRESCGADFIAGEEVTTLYWPRQEVTDSMESLATLVGLQHKLFALDAYDAARAVMKSCAHWKLTAANPMVANDHEWWADFPRRRTVTQELGGGGTYTVSTYSSIGTKFPERAKCLELAKSSPAYLQHVYCEYLTEGPWFEDPLLELLGVSTSRIRSSALAEGELTLTYKRD